MKNKLVTALKILIAYILIPLIALSIYIYVTENNKMDEIYGKTNYLVKDSLTMFWHIPNMNRHFDFAEYAPGGFNKKTNNLGFVKNRNTDVNKGNLIRVIITGDSHTDGVLPENESFPNLMEDSLNGYEVLNGGMGNFTFRNYYGVLKKFLYLKPDVFIVNVYTGNDFIENILYEESNLRFFNTLRTFWARLNWKYFNKYMNNSQSLAQIVYFHTYPQKIKESTDISIRYCDSIASLCKANGIKFYVSFLPTAVDVENRYVDNILSQGKYSQEDITISHRIKDDITSHLEKIGVQSIDLLPAMKTNNGLGLYYKSDDHINPAGNLVVSRILIDSL